VFIGELGVVSHDGSRDGRLTMRKGSTTTVSSGATAGLDLGDRFSQVCVLDAAGAVVLSQRVATTHTGLQQFFGSRSGLRVALESGTHSPWVSRLLAGLGHETIVGNPRRLRSITCNPRKSDRFDAEQLARLARADPKLLAPITHRGEVEQRHLALLHSRDQLVRTRTALALHVRCTLKSFGFRLPRHSMDSFASKAAAHVPAGLAPALAPVLELCAQLTEQIRAMEYQIERLAAEHYPVTRLLCEVGGVGTLTALCFVLVIADASRFRRSRDVPAYLGLVPRRHQSGERDPQLRITKTGDELLRRLLVGAAHYITGPFGKGCDLRAFGLHLAARGGKAAKKRAVVAVARKLAVLLHRLWVTGEVYDPLRARKRSTSSAPIAA
jgi:transposase